MHLFESLNLFFSEPVLISLYKVTPDDVKILRTAALFLIYSTSEHCAPAWCRSARTRHIISVINGVPLVVTECLRPSPTNDLPILTDIQPAGLRRLEATFALENRSIHDSHHFLYVKLVRLPHLWDTTSISACRKEITEFFTLDIRRAAWTDC